MICAQPLISQGRIERAPIRQAPVRRVADGRSSGAAGVLSREPTAPKTNAYSWRSSRWRAVNMADRVIRWSTALAVVGVAAVAAVVSYDHASALVRAHSEAGWTGRLIPLTVDGLIYASSMVMLDSARRGARVPALARWLLGSGIVATDHERRPRPGSWPDRCRRGRVVGSRARGLVRAVDGDHPRAPRHRRPSLARKTMRR
jgi:hypothetical protein